MKGIVDEGENVSVIYIDGKPSTKYAKKHEADQDAERLRAKFPNKKIEIKQEVRETEAKKGADGKRCWKGKRYAGTVNGKDKCIPVQNEGIFDRNVPLEKRIKKMSDDELGALLTKLEREQEPSIRQKYGHGAWMGQGNKDISAIRTELMNRKMAAKKTNEGVIVGHDSKDPEVAVLGGAGTMSLSRLKKKAQGEAEQLANDLTRGRFKAAAYNIKQLENTLKTIVAAEDEMEKRYFGEAVEGEDTYDIGSQLLDVAYEMKELADTAMNLVRGTPEEGRARSYWYAHIVMAIGDDHGYMGKSMATMTQSAEALMNSDDEEYMDEARPMTPALKAAQKNLIDLSTGEVRRREDAKRAAAKRQREFDREANRKPKKPTLDQIWQKVEHAISNYFPDGDPTDYLNPYMQKTGITWDDITRAAKRNGYNDLWDYWNTLTQDIENDAYYDWLAAPRPAAPVNPLSKDAADIQHSKWVAKNKPDIRSRGIFLEEPDTSGPVGTQPGGWRRTDMEEDTSFGTGMGQGGNAGESYRKFKPKSAGTFKESAILRGLKRESK